MTDATDPLLSSAHAPQSPEPSLRDIVAGPVNTWRGPDGRFQRGNPGKPRGARHRLANQVAAELLEDFWRDEAELIPRAKRWFFPQYLQLIARLLPRDVAAPTPDFSGYTAEERAAVAAAARAALDRIERGEAGLDELVAALEVEPASPQQDISNSP